MTAAQMIAVAAQRIAFSSRRVALVRRESAMFHDEGVAVDASELPMSLTAERAGLQRIYVWKLKAALVTQKCSGHIAKHATRRPKKL